MSGEIGVTASSNLKSRRVLIAFGAVMLAMSLVAVLTIWPNIPPWLSAGTGAILAAIATFAWPRYKFATYGILGLLVLLLFAALFLIVATELACAHGGCDL